VVVSQDKNERSYLSDIRESPYVLVVKYGRMEFDLDVDRSISSSNLKREEYWQNSDYMTLSNEIELLMFNIRLRYLNI
jgi:hypothetical protein